MSVLANQRRGSFKGVEFLMETSSTREGVVRANYMFVNSGRRISKPLSIFPPEFTLRCFTHSDDGDLYEQKRDAFRAVLSDTDPGTLVHPTLGNATCVAGVYTFEERNSEAGKCDFSIAFSVVDDDSGAPQTPDDRRASPSEIASLALDANRLLQSASAAAFTNNTPFNAENNTSLFASIAGALKDVFGPLGDTIAKAADYAGKALEFQQQAAYYANNPIVGFAAIADGILGVDGLTQDVLAKFKAVQALFAFGENGTEYSVVDTVPNRIDSSPTTNENAERLSNAAVATNFMQAASTLESYSQASSYKYTTVDEIETARAVLEEQFEKMRDQLTPTPDAQIYDFDVPQPNYSDFYEAMKDVRTAALTYFDEQKRDAARIEIIDIEPMPTSVLAYRLYGDSSRAVEINELNGTRETMNISGQIMVYSK